MGLSRIISTSTNSAETVKAGRLELTPRTRSTRLTMPGGLAHVVRERPHSVVVHEADGHERILRVRDLTRTIQIIITAGTAALALALITTGKTIKRRSPHE